MNEHMMKTTKILFLSALMLLGAIGCQSKEPDHAMYRAPAAQESPSSAAPAAPGDAALQARMIIRTATLTLEVDKPEQAATSINALLQAHSGFVLDTQAHTNTRGDHSATMTLRVPASQFEPTLGELRKLGSLRDEQIKGQDVTAEFVDVKARIKTQLQLEARLSALLEKAQDVDTILKIESELARVRQVIESAQGQEKYLLNQVQLSTITITLSPKHSTARATRSLGQEISEAFGDGREGAVVVVGGVIRLTLALLPVITIGALLTFVLVQLSRRRKRRLASRKP